MSAELPAMGRRTVVRAAVVTAWTAPVVQAVASSPAFAVSGPADISRTIGAVTFDRANADGSVPFTVSAVIKNSGGSVTKGLNAMVAWSPKANGGALAQPLGTPTGGGTWTRGSGQSWNAGTQVPAGGEQSFTLTGKLVRTKEKKAVKGTLKVTFVADGTTAVVSGII